MNKMLLQVLIAFGLALSTTPAFAAELLIAEFRFADEEFGHVGNNPPVTFLTEFSIGEQYIGRWMRDIATTDIGSTFTPGPDQLALMARGIIDDADGDVLFGVRLGPYLQFERFESTLLGAGYPNASLTMYVPSLESHPLGAVTITIDSLEIIQDPGAWRYSGGFTARLYADVVPEPCTWLGALIGICAITCLRHRATPHQPVPVV
jgi:hypothetical protein